MIVDLQELAEEIKAVKGLAKDAGSTGREFLRNVKKAESLLDKAKVAEATGDYEREDQLIEEIRSLL